MGAPRMSNAQKKMQKLRHLAQGKVFSMQRAKPLTFEPHMLKESNTKFGTRNGATFVKSASKVSQMELDGKEVAFAGRSNVGTYMPEGNGLLWIILYMLPCN